LAKQTVLVVDDEANIRELIAYNLKTEGYFVEEATTGEEALEACISKKPALVLLDIMLPGMDCVWQTKITAVRKLIYATPRHNEIRCSLSNGSACSSGLKTPAGNCGVSACR